MHNKDDKINVFCLPCVNCVICVELNIFTTIRKLLKCLETTLSSKHLVPKPKPLLPQVQAQLEEQSSETKEIASKNQV